MNRLTKKSSNGFLPKYERETKENYYDLVYKLGRLEDLEEDLGIDLLTLFKALKGIWIKDNDRTYYVGSPYLCFAENNERKLEMQFRVADTWFYIKDYGKTWALTKEELSE